MLTKRSSVTLPSKIGTAIAVLLMNRNQFLNQVQTIVSLILNAGHCSKQVSILDGNINDCITIYI